MEQRPPLPRARLDIVHLSTIRLFIVNQQNGAYDVRQRGTRERMGTQKNIYFDREASPLARVFCKRVKLAAQKPAGGAIIDNTTTGFSLKPSKGPQAITIDISCSSVRLFCGVFEKSSIVIEMDFDNPSAKTKITGIWGHSVLTYKIGQLLLASLPNWADSSERFWAATRQLIVICADEGRRLSFGDRSPSF